MLPIHINFLAILLLLVLECVNGDHGDYTSILAEAAMKPEWGHNYNSSRSAITNGDKVTEAVAEANGKNAHTPMSTSHVYPPPEWMRLWLLIGRCHVQIFRDWVCPPYEPKESSTDGYL